MDEEKENMCVCGDSADMHVDGQDQCVAGECGCKEFEALESSDDEEELPV